MRVSRDYLKHSRSVNLLVSHWHPTRMAHNFALEYRTVDAVYKLGSFPVPKNGRNVASMDKVIAREVQGVIHYESEKLSRSGHTYLGFILDLIFSEFANLDFPPAESLHVTQEWLKKHTPTALAASFSERPSEFPLYDSQRGRWNWPPLDGTTLAGASQEPLIASFFNAVANCLAGQVIPAREQAIRSSIEDPESTGLKENDKLPIPHRHWLGNYRNRRLPGAPKGAGAYNRHPDLILIESADQPPGSLSWTSPTALAEYTSEKWSPSMRLAKTLHTKAYLTLLDQPWRRFVLCISLCRNEMRVHFYDHSGICVSPAFDINAQPRYLLAVLSAFTFGTRLAVGFDPTISITPSRPLRVSPHRVIHFPTASGIPSTIHEDEKGERDADAEEEAEVRVELVAEAEVEPVAEAEAETEAEAEAEAEGEGEGEGEEAGGISNLDDEDYTLAPTLANSADILATRSRIGQIKVNDNMYDVLDVLFSSCGFFGRGTVIYLASRNEQTYVIKDHWVENVMNEVAMMDAMEGVPGVPRIVESSKVAVAEGGIGDTTTRYRPEGKEDVMRGKRSHIRIVMSPRGRRLTDFKSKHELVRCIRDVLVGK